MWKRFRDAMPVTQKWAYFDHAAVGPLPRPTAMAISDWCQQAMSEGDTVWPDWYRNVNTARERACRILGAQVQEIGLVPNTTHGISLVAEGFPWQQGDNVVTLANEFPSNLYPWMNLKSRGVETRLVKPTETGHIDLDQVLQACDTHTRIVSMSWIGFASGYRIDVAKFADAIHERGALFFLDAIQGVGVFPLDLARVPVDFLAADGHKWMLGPEGAGICFVRHSLLDKLHPIGVGWKSVVDCFDFSKVEFTLRPSADRFEGGTLNSAGFIGLGKSLELLEDLGVGPSSSPVADRVIELTSYACQQLSAASIPVTTSRQMGHESGIVGFQLPGRDLAEVRRECLSAGIVLSHRNGSLRISPHAYNVEEEIDRLIDVLKTSRTRT